MEIVAFQIQPRPDTDTNEYEKAFARMLELVQTIAGFVDIKGFVAEDGTELALAWFESDDAIARWRDHPEHVRTRERGREEFFASYDITVARVSRHYSWPRPEQADNYL